MPERRHFQENWEEKNLGSGVGRQGYFFYLALCKYDISDPTLVDLTSNFFVLSTNINVYLHNYS